MSKSLMSCFKPELWVIVIHTSKTMLKGHTLRHTAQEENERDPLADRRVQGWYDRLLTEVGSLQP